MQEVQPVYTTKSLASQFQVTTKTILYWILQGHLEAARVGRGYRISQPAVDAYKKLLAGFSINEAAKVLDIHRRTLERAIHQGALDARLTTRGYRIDQSSLEAYWQKKGGGQLFHKETDKEQQPTEKKELL